MPQAVHYALERMGLPLKKTLRPAELNRPDIRRARILGQATGGVLHRRLLFIDESGAKTNMTRLYGRGPARPRLRSRAEWPMGNHHDDRRHWPQWSASALGARRPMDGAAFAAWAEHVLAPTLEPQDIVAMDNLSVHKNALRARHQSRRAEIWDLPPYSPDLNPIEQMWSKIKPTCARPRREPRIALQRHRGRHGNRFFQDIVNWFAAWLQFNLKCFRECR